MRAAWVAKVKGTRKAKFVEPVQRAAEAGESVKSKTRRLNALRAHLRAQNFARDDTSQASHDSTADGWRLASMLLVHRDGLGQNDHRISGASLLSQTRRTERWRLFLKQYSAILPCCEYD